VRLQQVVPEAVRGRVFAAENAAFMLAMTISTGIWGELIDLDVMPVQTLSGGLGLLLAIPAGLWALRGMRLGWGDPPPEAPVSR
jgi:hypothetical protein